MKRIEIFICILFCVASVSSCSYLKPVVIATVANQNVYKTKETIDLKRVYDRDNKIPINDTTIYRLKPQTANDHFLRYRVVKEGKNTFIYILPYTKLTGKNNADIVGFHQGDTLSEEEKRSFYYQFVKKAEEFTPPSQYLATEHISALPVTIPVKIRLKVPEKLNAITVNPSISYAFGYKFRTNNDPYKDHFIRLSLLAIGFSTDTYLAESLIETENYKGEPSVALNIATGITFEASKFNVGVFAGWDRMFGSRNDWIYQNKTWLGVGFGYKFDAAK